jgi:RimJ/RimL family protein N-acetyltransferase
VHVTVDVGNQRAQAFYPKVGFERFQVGSPPTGVVLYGRSW